MRPNGPLTKNAKPLPLPRKFPSCLSNQILLLRVRSLTNNLYIFPCILLYTHSRLQPIRAGAQVYDSYGQKCNHRFLLNYGFAVEDNRELDGFCPNEVPIDLTLIAADPLFPQKLEFWMRGESALNKSHIKRIRVSVSNNENTRLLFSLLRALNCNADELQAISTPVTGDMRALFMGDHRGALSAYHRTCRDIRHPLTIRNERASMIYLLQNLSSTLAKYPTTLTQDQADLLDERAYPRLSNKRHAKIQVRGEKEVVHHYIQWARTALEVLDVIDQEVKDEQQKGGVEVQLGRGVVPDDSMMRSGRFEYLVRRMEEDETGLHHTIVRYCADVLGSLRREELKHVRRQKAVLASVGGKMG